MRLRGSYKLLGRFWEGSYGEVDKLGVFVLGWG